MAIVEAVVTESASIYDKFNTFVWTLAGGVDTAVAIQAGLSGDKSVQSSGGVTIEGSNDGVNYFTLNDTGGLPLVFAGPGIKQILELTRFIRPTGFVAPVVVTLLGKRQF